MTLGAHAWTVPEPWELEWRGMPDYHQEAKPYYATVDVRFRSEADTRALRKQLIEDEKGRFAIKRSRDISSFLWGFDIKAWNANRAAWMEAPGPKVLPRYPIYIPSKGRAEHQYTSKSLNRLGVAHFVIVEEDELALYEQHKQPLATLLVLPVRYKEEFETCDDVPWTERPLGPACPRNFAWDHAKSLGAEWHWTMDDNIDGWFRLHENAKRRVFAPGMLRAMEAFCERYDNIAQAGPHYQSFAIAKEKHAAFAVNTRVFSCQLTRTDLTNPDGTPWRWRSRYNDDVDFSLRLLKAGWCTVQFFAFLQNKMTTQRVPGGSTQHLYVEKAYDKERFDLDLRQHGRADLTEVERRYAQRTHDKSWVIVRLHPDVATVIWRWGRWHHYVDYSVFRQKLHRKPGVRLPDKPDPFGMVLVHTPIKPHKQHNTATWRVPKVVRFHFTSEEGYQDFLSYFGQRKGVTEFYWPKVTAHTGLVPEVYTVEAPRRVRHKPRPKVEPPEEVNPRPRTGLLAQLHA